MPESPKLLGMADAARILGVSVSSARRTLINAPGVTLQRINGRAWTIEESALLAFVETRKGYKGRGRLPTKTQPTDETDETTQTKGD